MHIFKWPQQGFISSNIHTLGWSSTLTHQIRADPTRKRVFLLCFFVLFYWAFTPLGSYFLEHTSWAHLLELWPAMQECELPWGCHAGNSMRNLHGEILKLHQEGCPWNTEWKQVIPLKSCAQCKLVSKINNFCCFESFCFGLFFCMALYKETVSLSSIVPVAIYLPIYKNSCIDPCSGY